MSLSHALALAESVRRKIDSASHDSEKHVLNADEIAASHVEKKKARTTCICDLTDRLTFFSAGSSRFGVLHRCRGAEPSCSAQVVEGCHSALCEADHHASPQGDAASDLEEQSSQPREPKHRRTSSRHVLRSCFGQCDEGYECEWSSAWYSIAQRHGHCHRAYH